MIRFLHDMPNPADPRGRSYKECNLEVQHDIPVGSLVELEDGVRLFVVAHCRDCDGTPLYSLCHDKTDTVREREGFANRRWVSGYPAHSLTVIRRASA